MENIIKNFIDKPTINNVYNMLNELNQKGKYNIGLLIGLYMMDLYPNDLKIKIITTNCAFYTKKYRLTYELCEDKLEKCNLTENERKNIVFNQSALIRHICDDYINYDRELIEKITSNVKKEKYIKKITFTITTCKRYDLFEKTINSFINCCTDVMLIDEWLCVDDNSSDEDRKKMEEKYPFFTFYWKTKEEKGHPQSMNIIKEKVKTPYIFHMEDDWKFFCKKDYMKKCMDILLSDDKIGQCLINKNYGEIDKDIDILGGILGKTQHNNNYYVHEYTPDDKSKIEFIRKYGRGKSCAYWAHFSLRPSLLKKEVLDVIGKYNENISHFEMDYSNKYVKKGFKSVFLTNIYCLHIGRLTSQRNNKSILNAYDLNEEKQFIGKEDKKITIKNTKTYVINLKRRDDRMKLLEKNCKITYERINAVDGSLLKPNKYLQRIFEGNDYNMREGMVGCAMSHIKLLIECIKSKEDIFCFLEDDIKLAENFREKINDVMDNLPEDWDMIYLGHHLYPKYENEMNGGDKIRCEKWDMKKSFRMSMGGTFAYLINKKGANKLLEFINENGMTNGIDTVQQKAIKVMNTYYCNPSIIFSECVLPNNNVDSDIQKNYKSLSMTNYNKEPYIDRLKQNGMFNIDNAIEIDENKLKEQKIKLEKDVEKIKEQFKFYPKLDQKNYDCYIYKDDILSCMKKALNDENCVGFNTLGFFKSDVFDLKKSEYFNDNDGIYIKIKHIENNQLTFKF